MNFRFVNKRFVAISIIILLILVIGGFFIWSWWSWKEEQRSRTFWNIEYMKSDYFKVEERAGERIMINKKAGLTAKVPTSWGVTTEGEGMSFYSPDVKFRENGALIFQSIKDGGCAVNVQVIKCGPIADGIPTDADDLRGEIIGVKENSYSLNDRKMDVLNISGKDGLRTSHINKDGVGKISFKIPIGQTIYSFDSGFIFSDKCIGEFDNFIKTISIK